MDLDFEVKGTDLAKVLTNVSLWHDPGVGYTGGHMFIQSFALTNQVAFYASDGYVAAMDEVTVSYLDKDRGSAWNSFNFLLTEGEVDLLLLAARAVKTKTITLSIRSGQLMIPYTFERDEKGKAILSEVEGNTLVGTSSEEPEWVNFLEEAIEGNEEPVNCSGFLIRPERWLKLSRVKADKDAPIAVKFIEPWNENAPAVALIKIGDTFRAAVNFVESEVARANLGIEKAGSFLW